MFPVIGRNDEVLAYYCAEQLPDGSGWCGFSIMADQRTEREESGEIDVR
ncbi:hypothetical protein ACWDTT_15885 [Streptosporangium sandarakinum]